MFLKRNQGFGQTYRKKKKKKKGTNNKNKTKKKSHLQRPVYCY